MRRKFLVQIDNASKFTRLKPQLEKETLNHIKEDDGIIFGARSIQRQIGLFARPTVDFDVQVKKPKKSANKLQKKLDKVWGSDFFYAKKGKFAGLYKVKTKGFDGIKGTEDDKTIADFNKVSRPKPKTININGIRYRKLQEEIAAKNRAIRMKGQEFRRPKDMEDLERIKLGRFGK